MHCVKKNVLTSCGIDVGIICGRFGIFLSCCCFLEQHVVNNKPPIFCCYVSKRMTVGTANTLMSIRRFYRWYKRTEKGVFFISKETSSIFEPRLYPVKGGTIISSKTALLYNFLLSYNTSSMYTTGKPGNDFVNINSYTVF